MATAEYDIQGQKSTPRPLGNVVVFRLRIVHANLERELLLLCLE